MKLFPLISLGSVLLASSCASRYSTLPPDAGTPPSPDTLLKAMSTRLSSAKRFRFTATDRIPKEVADAMKQSQKAEINILVARPDKVAVKIEDKGVTRREMIFNGRTFTVVDGVNNFYSKVPLRGTLDKVPVHMAEIYGFQPPLAEFIISNPYEDIRRRVQTISYLGKGTVRESGGVVTCHRIGLRGSLADAELWIGIEDSLPRRLKATRSNSGGEDLLMDVDFLTWDFNPEVSSSAFTHQPAPGSEEIEMITLEKAKNTNN